MYTYDKVSRTGKGGGMTNLTPTLEIMVGDILDALDDMLKHRGSVDPLYVRDLVAELQVEVEDALTLASVCRECGEVLPPLCPDCARWELENEAAHREEVQMAHAATNGTL
jgi:hypothetical protein